MNIPLVLQTIRPNSDWSLNGEEYSGLEWLDVVQTKPSWAEMEAAWAEIQSTPLPASEATPLQVRAFLIRQSIGLDTIPALIASQTAEGAAREEALMRWEYALSFPKDYPLVVAVANALSLDLDQAWASILAIE